MTLGRKRVIEFVCSLLFGATMVAIESHAGPEPIFGVVGAFGLLFGIVVSMNYQVNPVMIAAMVLYWAFLGWLCYRGVLLLIQLSRGKSVANDRDV